MSGVLPEGFAALEPFVGQWAVPTLAGRCAARDASDAEQRQTFYDAACPLAAAALDYLDTRPYAALAGADLRLMHLMLGFAQAALAVEIQGEDEDRLATFRPYMRITHVAWEPERAA
jgi:hypothetical protein